MPRAACVAALVLLLAPVSAAQTPAAAPAVDAPPAASLSRWIEPLILNLGLLDQNQHDDDGRASLAQLRMQLQAGARVKFDAAARYSLVASGGTGPSFRSGWNHTGVGAQPAVATLSVKHLYVVAAPWAPWQLQAGSLPAWRGQATEMTGLDNDAYLTGARASMRAKGRLWFDEIVVTRAWLGDLKRPSAFDRLHRLSDANYVQAGAARRLGASAFSVEIVDQPDLRTLGAAVVTHGIRGVTTARVEASVSIRGEAAHAAAALVERVVGRVTLGGGASFSDGPLGELNGDRYTAGQRLFAVATWRPRPEIAASCFAGRALDARREPRTRLDLLVSYDLVRALRGRREPTTTPAPRR